MTHKPILLVEDNPDDEALALMAFRKNGIDHEIVVAHDGVEALDLLFGTGERVGQKPLEPQFVLLDINLPRIDGLQVLKRIREDPGKAALPVIMLTSSKEERDLIAGYRLGCNSYVRKPVDFQQFVESARQLGLYWLLLNLYPESQFERIAS